MPGRIQRWGKILLCTAAGLLGLWVSLRFLLPWFAPFLLALALAALMEPLVRRLVRWHWRRSAAAGLVSLSLLGLLLWALIRGAGILASGAVALGKQLPQLMLNLSGALERLEESFLRLAQESSPALGEVMVSSLTALGDALYTIPNTLSQWALDALARAAQKSPDLLLFAVTAGIGSYFASAAYPRILAFLAAQIPERWKRRLSGLGQDLKSSFGGFLRAQLILMGMGFFVLVLGFWVLGIPRALLLAALTALVDALPVFGTGLILIPWALYCLLLGSSRQGLGLLLCWGLVSLLRGCLQAKLVGDQIGLHPLASLLAVYVGWQVCGVWGMLFFPILLVLLQQLNDKGLVKLWKNI